MADQQNISQILAALAAQRPGGTPTQALPPQPIPTHAYPGAYPSSTPPIGAPNYALPQPNSSGSVDLSSIKPVNSGQVSIADAIAKAKGFAAAKGVSYEPNRSQSRDTDPRMAGRPYRRSRSPSRTPPRITRDNFRDNYNPYRDERRDDRRGGADRGYVRERSYSPRPGARGPNTFSPPPSRQYGVPGDRSPGLRGGGDDNSETIIIESNLVGLIIGRSGDNMRRIEADTGARVQFLNSPDANSTQRHCKISGSRTARADAKEEIFRIIQENGGPSRANAPTLERHSRGPGKAPNQPSLREGENSMQIMVPDRTVGLIIGRGGETIRDLQERSGCHVNIVGEQKSVNGLRPVNLIGSAQTAQKAKDLIMEIVDSDTKSQANPNRQEASRGGGHAAHGGDHHGGGGDKINDIIMVPGEAVGMIIGKGGESIKEMQNSTGCKINVTPASGRDVEREIGLVGSRYAIEQAKRAIMEKVDAVEQKNRSQAPRHDDPYSDRYSQPQQPSAQQGAGQMSQQASAPQGGADVADPYAAYGGYQNYVAMWYAAMAQQQQQGGPGPGEQPGPPGA